MSGLWRRRRGRLVALALVVATAAGCQLEVQVGIDVADDGTGQIQVVGALDEVAASRVPDLADQLEVDDLVDAGWTVTGPTLEADGRTWLRASKPFSSPEEAGAVLDEISGEDGPFRDFEVRRSSSLLRHQWEFTGYVDLTAGLAGFSDDALRERLDGTDVGQSEGELVAAAGRGLSDMFTFRVAVALPGDVTSNAPGSLEGGAVWRPTLGEQLTLNAIGSQLNIATLLWLAVAVAFGLALVVLVVVRLRGRRAGVTARAPERPPTSEEAAAPEMVTVPAGAAAPEPDAGTDGGAAPEPTPAHESSAPAPRGTPVRPGDRSAGPAPAPSDGSGTVAGPSDAADGGDPSADPAADGAAVPAEDAAVEPDAADLGGAQPDAVEPDAVEPDAASSADPSDDADDDLREGSGDTGTAPAGGQTGQVDQESQRAVRE